MLALLIVCAVLTAVIALVALYLRAAPGLKRWLFITRVARAAPDIRLVVVDEPRRQVVMETPGEKEARIYCTDVDALVDAVITDGVRGLAAAYIAGTWSTPSLLRVATVVHAGGFDPLVTLRPRYKQPRQRRQSLTRRRFDVGEDFAASVYDTRFVSDSPGLFDGPGVSSLEDAQERKREALLSLVGAGPGHSVLVDPEHNRFATTTGVAPFDRVLSLDTIPRVGGRAGLPAFFKGVAGRLADGGAAVFQTLVTTSGRDHRDSAAFISPDLFVPRLEWLTKPLAAAGLTAVKIIIHGGPAIAPSYAAWRANLARLPADGLTRAHAFHFAVCEASCRAGDLALAHILVEKKL